MNGRGIIDTILGLGNREKHQKLVDTLYKELHKRVEWQLKAAMPNLKTQKLENGVVFSVLDVEKYAHKFTFLQERPAVMYMTSWCKSTVKKYLL